MQRGISPIVATVLLISISVIAATGIWFWVGGLASKQSTPNTPVVIGAQVSDCTTETESTVFDVSALVQNLDLSDDLDEPFFLIADNGTCGNDSIVPIGAGEQAMVTFDCTSPVVGVTKGATYTLYAVGSGSAVITC